MGTVIFMSNKLDFFCLFVEPTKKVKNVVSYQIEYGNRINRFHLSKTSYWKELVCRFLCSRSCLWRDYFPISDITQENSK